MNKILDLFRPSSRTQLGPLERQMLETLWERGSATVRELVDDGETKLAYTTIMTTLDRLYKKQLLDRFAEGRAFRYSPRQTQEELQRAVAGETIRKFLDSEKTATLPLSYLVEAIGEHDSHLLDQLQELLDQKRRQLKREERS